jgi:predicted metal-dependent peptidase
MAEEEVIELKPMTEAEEKKYEKIFQDAMALLIKNHTFFGHILAHMVRISTKDVRTMGVTVNPKGQIVLFYNTEMIRREIEENKSSLKQVTAMIQHEVYHVINEHFLRAAEGKYDAWIITTIGPMSLFNVGADCAINQYIPELPDWVIKLDSFKDLKLPPEETAEVYYKLLYKKAEENAEKLKDKLKELGGAMGVMLPSSGFSKQSKNSGGVPMSGSSGGKGEDKKGEKKGISSGKEKSDIDKINQWLPFDKNKYEEFMDRLQKEGRGQTSKQTGMTGDHGKWDDVKKIPKEMVNSTVKQAVKESYNKAKFGGQGIGDMPAGIDRMCKETLRPTYNFEPFLRRFVDGELFGRYEQTRKRPNRRYRWEHPGKKTETKGKIAVLADTSGSINNEDIAVFAKNLGRISEYMQIILFDVDHGIENVREYTKRNFDNVLNGGGGTDFRAVFKILENYEKNKNLLRNVPEKQKLKARMLCQGIQALIVMTDGMATGCPNKKPKYPVMWALTQKCYTPPKKWGEVIYLDNKPEKHQRRRY